MPEPGDVVWIRRAAWRVERTSIGEGLTELSAVAVGTGRSHAFLLPAECVRRQDARRLHRVSQRYARAWLAARTARVQPAGTPGAILPARTTLLAFQLEPALAVLAGTRRVLIADAVGLGKTVQAALVIAEVLARQSHGRALVLAPAPLITQWADELAARFSLQSQVADTITLDRLRAERPYLADPWSAPGVWLASPDYLKQPHVREAMPRVPWDVLVIDEAHTMGGDSQRAEAADALARTARRVVLLTATPHDGDDTRFRRLCSLGATGAHADGLLSFRRTRPHTGRRVRRIHLRPDAPVVRVLAAIDAFERTLRPESAAHHRQALHLLCSLFRKRTLSSLAALAASLDRRLTWVTSQQTPVVEGSGIQLDLFPADSGGDVIPADEWPALTADAGLPVARERSWLQRMQHLASAPHGDRKLTRLSTLLRRANEPAIVFTEYRDSLTAVHDALCARHRLAVLHGGLTPALQRRALGAFLDGSADVLLATDVASQGLNLQHRARWVICLDLPWTPMRLEQRVGRVDRIGQSRAVHVTMVGARHAADAALRARVTQRQDASAMAPLPSCRRWTCAAAGLARLFARQRALAARWRGPDPVRVPRAQVPASLLRRICGAAAGTPPSPLTIVDIPLVGADGIVVERHIGWHAGEPARAEHPAAIAPAIERRARVLTARERRRRRSMEAALALSPTGAMQPGLFDPRVIAELPIGDDLPPARAAECVRAGTPQPVLVLELRGARP